MENQPEKTNASHQNIKLALDFDDFEFNEESIRPLSQGLGFHQSEKSRPTSRPLRRSISEIKQSKIEKPLPTERPAAIVQKGTLGGLNAFYSHIRDGENSINNNNSGQRAALGKIKTKKVRYEIASKSESFLATIVDTLFVSLLCSFVALIPIPLLKINFEQYQSLLLKVHYLPYFVAYFSLFFLLYFSLLDLEGTPGKKICSLKLVALPGSSLNATTTFIRSFVILTSLFLLGIPLFFNLHGKLSHTEIVKR